MFAGRKAQPQVIEKALAINGAVLDIELAKSGREQTQGLSGRESLAENQGMLFVYRPPSRPPFWMKDMLFGIDLIWVSDNWEITQISKNVSPDTFPQTFSPVLPTSFVLEVSAGFAKKHNIFVGDRLEPKPHLLDQL